MIDLYEFGPYRLDFQRRVFTHGDRVVPLAPKTFELLLLLVRSEGRAVSKAELMRALWPDTFVEEANLTFQISALRKALGDGGSQLIETVPKHGYRFTGDVKVVPDSVAGLRAAEIERPTPDTSPHRDAERHANRQKRIAVFIAACILAIISYAVVFRPQSQPSASSTHVGFAAVPLTSYPGFENAPSLSPDGSLVAFSWNDPEKKNNFDIYVKLVGAGDPIPLTKDPARDDNPSFSPDGRRIAFERFTTAIGMESKADLYVVPALGGGEKRVATEVGANPGLGVGPNGSLSWTPDGKWLAHWAEDRQAGIWLFEVDGSHKRRLTDAGAGPAFSKDGLRMAFIQTAAAGVAVDVLPLTPDLMAAGEPHRVTPEVSFIRTVAWTPDGHGLVFSAAGHLGVSRLYSVALTSTRLQPVRPPELLPFGEHGDAFSLSSDGRLVYSAPFRDTNLWRFSLSGSDEGRAVTLAASTYDEHTPDYSPDGTRLAFTSTRTGSEEIWIANADGSTPM